MYAISYLELNICCLIIMMLILHKQVRGLDKRLTSQTFTELIVSAMVYIFLDMIYGLQQNAVIHLPVTVSKIVNVMMFVSLYSLTHLVFAFMECELGRTWVEDSKKRQLSLIPALILTIMTICSLKWHFFFYVDAEGIFQRGAFYGVIIPFVYIYIFFGDTSHFYNVSSKEVLCTSWKAGDDIWNGRISGYCRYFANVFHRDFYYLFWTDTRNYSGIYGISYK